MKEKQEAVIRILEPGSPITIGPEKDRFPATVVGVSLRKTETGYSISYECVWYTGKERRTEWLYPCEIHSFTKTRVVGFYNQ